MLANQGEIDPVILLTKADLTDDVGSYQRRAAAMQRGLVVVILDPRSANAPAALARWCSFGRTVALVGSSGVGKSSLVNKLTSSDELPQQTGSIREHDAKGRHTTTARSLHAMASGGWVIDTPGMRTLHVIDADRGIEILFAEITELAPLCRFRDCTHAHEPGCAVQAAIKEGSVDPERLNRWRKLSEESGQSSPTAPGLRRTSTAGAGRSKKR